MCKNLKRIPGEAKWQTTALLLVPILSSISQYLNEKKFSQIWNILATGMQRMRKPRSDQNLQLWYPTKPGKCWFWLEICLVGWYVCGCGVWGYFCPSSLSPVNNLSDLCWAKNRADISNIFLKRIKRASYGSKKIHFCLLFHSKIFPLHQ